MRYDQERGAVCRKCVTKMLPRIRLLQMIKKEGGKQCKQLNILQGGALCVFAQEQT